MFWRMVQIISHNKKLSPYKYIVSYKNLVFKRKEGSFYMEIKEKIKKSLSKNNIIVNDETIEAIMQDKKRTEGLMRLYKDEEINSMNYIFGKDKNNKIFTKFELEATSKIDLFNRNTVKIRKIIWDNRHDERMLDSFMKELTGGAN